MTRGLKYTESVQKTACRGQIRKRWSVTKGLGKGVNFGRKSRVTLDAIKERTLISDKLWHRVESRVDLKYFIQKHRILLNLAVHNGLLNSRIDRVCARNSVAEQRAGHA